MPEGAQTGFLLLADISGYTSYVSATELEHSNEILSDLLEVITDGIVPPLTLAKLEGDAVFAYEAPGAVRDPRVLLDGIDATYLAFRDRVEGMRRRTTCECNACRRIPMLDLKFILHHGEFIIQRMAVGQELLGSDVNLVHRLLKNSVGAETGWSAYALCTQAAIDAVTLPSEFLHQQSETYEHLGEVQTYSYDLRARYSTMVEGRRVKIDPKDADVVFEVTVKAAPHVVWSWLNEPQRMVQWMGVKDVKPETRPEGRVGIGSRNHCVHGKSAMLQTVLDWRPYEYFTLENLGPMTLIMSFILEPVDSGTHLRLTVRPQTKVPRFAARQICRMAMRSAGMQDKLETLANLCAGECAAPGNMVALAVPTQ
jgi:uncharacterized protein YndB with AHSA1/START domain